MSLEEVLPADAPFDTDGLELAAAAIELAFREPQEESLPEALRGKVLFQAKAYYAAASASEV